jgi:hypothetical protein
MESSFFPERQVHPRRVSNADPSGAETPLGLTTGSCDPITPPAGTRGAIQRTRLVE